MNTQRTVGQKLVLAAMAIVVCLRPVSGAPTPGAHPAMGEVPACCVEQESCCGQDEHRDSGPVFLPGCCGIDTPPSDPRESEPLPRLSIPEPTRRLLRELARALQQVDLPPSGPWHLGAWQDGAGLSPPDLSRESSSKSCHWLTDRELLAALAMLSVARL